MIPYFPQPTLNLGLFTIHAFGVLVAIAILIGTRLTQKRAARAGLPRPQVDGLLTWVLVGGFAGAHLVDRLVYFPHETLEDPMSLLWVWKGISSFGGFTGAVVGALWWLRRQHPAAEERWKYLDSVAYALPFGWISGRAGCFVAFDHPGRETTFWLAMADAEGKIRHNLGLDELIYTIAIAAAFAILGRKPRTPGFFTGLLAIVYAPIRFLLDFLRAIDVRYGGLTPGQWGSIALVVVGAVILRRSFARARAVGGAAAPAAS